MFDIDNDKKISKLIWTKKQYQKMEDDMRKIEKSMSFLIIGVVILSVVVAPIILLTFFK